MKILAKARKFEGIRAAVAFIAIGLVIAVISALALNAPKAEYADCEGVISKIESELSTTDDGYDYHVFVDYEVNGVKYKDVEYGSYSSTMKVGDTVKIKYDVANPAHITSPGAEMIPYITLAAGAVAAIVGVILLVKGITTKSSELDDYDKVDMSKVSPEQIEEVKNDDSPMRKYFFHYDMKIKQGYVMEDENKTPAFEAKMEKLTFFKPYEFEFINKRTGSSVSRKISHTVSTTSGTSEGISPLSRSFSVLMSSKFKIDGENCWDYIARNGYSIDVSLQGIKPCYRIKKYGVEVAYAEAAGTNVITGKDSAIGKLPTSGIFSVECKDSDMEMIFMICFAIARAGVFSGN